MAEPVDLPDRSRALAQPADAASRRGGPRIGPIRVTPIRLVVGLAFLGSLAFIAYAVVIVRDATQIPMLSSGFAVLGLATAAIALAVVIELWRSASAGRSGRALALAILGGVIGLGAIGCFTLTVLLALLWSSS